MSGPEPGDVDQQVADLINGLTRLPAHEGISFRGIGSGDRFGHSTASLVTTGLTATSRDARVATENFTSVGLYAVVGTQGRLLQGVSVHPAEREVVFLPATLLRVVTRVRFEELPVVVVEQLDPERDPDRERVALDDVLAEIATLVRRARAREDVEVTSPGKFVGDVR